MSEDKQQAEAEAEPAAGFLHINELMDRDPLDLSDEELDVVVRRIRAGQDKFRADAFKKSKVEKKTKTSSATRIKVDKSVSLSDLGL